MSIHRVVRGAVLAAAMLSSTAAMAAPRRPHPHFDDRGALGWYQNLEEARQAARASGKLIFIDYGRLACGNCRRLVTSVLPNPAVRDRLNSVAVGLASDCDRADPRVEAIFQRGLGNASMLPFVGFVTHDLRWVTGWAGGKDVYGVARELGQCEAFLRRQGGVAGSPAAATPRVATSPPARSAPTTGGRPAPSPAKPAPSAPKVAPRPLLTADSPCGEDEEMHCEGGVCSIRPRQPAPCAPTPLPREPAVAAAPPAPARAPSASSLPDPRPVEPAPVEAPRPRVAVGPASRPAASAPAPRTPSGTPPTLASSTPAPVRGASPGRPPAPAPILAVRAPRGTDPAPATLLERARLAASEERWGDVIRLGNEAEKAPPSTDSWEMDLLVRKARTWALDGMNDAVQDALRGDYDGAAKVLERVRRAMVGLPVEIDAERGQRALLRLTEIARGSPDASETPDSMRKTAYSEFRGTRWAVLFKAI